MSNDLEQGELRRANIELRNLIERFLVDTDAIFKSKTWRLGFFFAKQQRRLMRLGGSRQRLAHIGRQHFRGLAANCCALAAPESSHFAEGEAAAADRSADSMLAVAHEPADFQVNIPDVPADYVVGDVDTTVQDLWDLARRGAMKNG